MWIAIGIISGYFLPMLTFGGWFHVRREYMRTRYKKEIYWTHYLMFDYSNFDNIGPALCLMFWPVAMPVVLLIRAIQKLYTKISTVGTYLAIKELQKEEHQKWLAKPVDDILNERL